MPRPSLTPSTTTLAWWTLLALTGLSVAAAGVGHQGSVRFWMTAAVAAIAWVKAQLLLREYLELQRTAPVFRRLIQGFAALTPLGLVVSALHELAR
ncbi:MAG TPA: cytochrome C oxidase subunit IV family protein [Burkholderiaceae bacterium]|nr:cytochrome C oxidase subunit IV family protein [Burkholderiaceae bacterium]HNB46662.1 cytochrome C oxidase subunit IV family protein [Burkholderiaceae bacterium]HNG81985.1 cytochrome C oxidase subunit IV family protein [Burkholderiaceae bacterium]